MQIILTEISDHTPAVLQYVWFQGYGEKDNYIITQMPFPETMKDIWRIVFDRGISTIVMMNVVDDTYEVRSNPVYGNIIRSCVILE
jgi:protein tyrosine phosphatase